MYKAGQGAFCDINGARLYYEIAGLGTPIVLIHVHGFGLDLRMWDDQFGVLAEDHRVLRYDARGFGNSSLPDGAPYTHADDLNALLEFLNIEAATIIGLSMGGRIALNFTLNFAPRVRKLVLVDSALNGFQWSHEWQALWQSMQRVAVERSPKAANELWLAHPLFAPAREHPHVRARLAQMVGDYSGWHWNHQDSHRPTPKPDEGRLGELNVPTLVLVGERDLPDFHRIADILHRGIKGARREIIPGVGHMSNMEAPEHFNRAVLSFLRAFAA